MDQLDLSVFQQSHRLAALIDSDPQSTSIRNRFIRKCEELGIPVTRLERYALENYFSLSAIASVMKRDIPPTVKAVDPKKKVADQLGFEVKRNSGEIARAMCVDDIKGTDLDRFFQSIVSLLNTSKIGVSA